MIEAHPILITGGAGFIGSNLVHRAIDRGLHIVNLDALTYAGNLASLADLEGHPRHDFYHGNICDGDLVGGLMARHKPRAIINLAAESHVDRSIERPSDFIETNVVGTQRLLTCAMTYWESLPSEQQEIFRYIQVSTDEVYGSIAHGQADEDSAYAPNSPYAASKAAGDHLVRAFHRTYGLPAIITNSSNNYGPFQFPEKLIPLVIQKARLREPIPVYGDGLQRRDWIHVDDHCAALLRVLEAGVAGRAYNIGGDYERSNLEMVKEICRILEACEPEPRTRPYESLITFVEDRPGHDRRYALSSERIKAELGWRAQVALAEGLRQTVAWYLANRSWIDEIRQHRYGGRRLGLRAAR